MSKSKIPASQWRNADRNKSRINALGRVFAKTDRILTGRRDVTVTMTTTKETGIKAPGFSDGKNIFVNTDRIADITHPIGLVRLSAVNYHETCHILFTPKDEVFRRELHDDGSEAAFNILEDQRIETLFVAMYRPAAKYFTEIVVQLFLMNQRAWRTAHLFTYGRRYLPLEVRAQLEARFAGTDVEKEHAQRIIDEYRLLPMTAKIDFDRARDLCSKFQKILDSLNSNGEIVPFNGDSDGSGSCTDYNKTVQEARFDKIEKKVAESASAQAEEDTAEQDEAEAEGEDGSGFWEDVLPDEEEDEEGAEGSASGKADDDDEEDSDGGEGDADADGEFEESDDDEADDDGDDAGSGEDSGDSGEGGDHDGDDTAGGPAGNQWSDTQDDEDFRELILEVQQAIHDSDDVQNDVSKIRSAMQESALELDAAKMKGRRRSVTPDEANAAYKTELEYRRLYAEMSPGWNYGADHGRLNVQRAMAGDISGDYDDIFDEWDEGIEHEAGLESTILLDLSGSMDGVEDTASSVLWIIKKALDAVEATTSVIGFEASTFTLYQRQDKCDLAEMAVFPANGWDTAPANGMIMARRILNASESPNRLFIIITDGAWSDTMYTPDGSGNGSANFPELLGQIEAFKMFIGIGAYTNCPFPQDFDFACTVTDPGEIPDKVRTVVTSMLHRIIEGRRN